MNCGAQCLRVGAIRIDHQNAQSWRSQKDKLLSADSLQLMVTALQDSIMQLEVGKNVILEAVYGNAFSAY